MNRGTQYSQSFIFHLQSIALTKSSYSNYQISYRIAPFWP